MALQRALHCGVWCREINSVLALHRRHLQELDQLEQSFKGALGAASEAYGDGYEFFRSSNPSAFEHRNRKASPRHNAQREREAEASKCVNQLLEEPVLAKRVNRLSRAVS